MTLRMSPMASMTVASTQGRDGSRLPPPWPTKVCLPNEEDAGQSVVVSVGRCAAGAPESHPCERAMSEGFLSWQRRRSYAPP